MVTVPKFPDSCEVHIEHPLFLFTEEECNKLWLGWDSDPRSLGYEPSEDGHSSTQLCQSVSLSKQYVKTLYLLSK